MRSFAAILLVLLLGAVAGGGDAVLVEAKEVRLGTAETTIRAGIAASQDVAEPSLWRTA